MPGFTMSAHAGAPVEEVWKLLHDAARFPEWWTGFPAARRLDVTSADSRVTISCLVADIVFRWQLSADGETTGITVDVEIPEAETHRTAEKEQHVRQSLARLVALAERPIP